jgi:hypothetical protein
MSTRSHLLKLVTEALSSICILAHLLPHILAGDVPQYSVDSVPPIDSGLLPAVPLIERIRACQACWYPLVALKY